MVVWRLSRADIILPDSAGFVQAVRSCPSETGLQMQKAVSTHIALAVHSWIELTAASKCSDSRWDILGVPCVCTKSLPVLVLRTL